MTLTSLLNLHELMVLIRVVEEKIAHEYQNQEMRCPVHLSIGQEAVPAGISQHLDLADHVVSAHRSHAHYLSKGGDIKKLFGELLGKKTGCVRGKGGSMHLLDAEVNFTAAVPIVGSSISIGTGIGFGLKHQCSPNIVVVYFGDGATEEGAFAESIDFAVLANLPVMFVCENNFYSVYTDLRSRQHPARNIQDICKGHGLKSFVGDGNDAEQVSEITRQARDYMFKKQKPTLLEFETYRWLEHCGPNWDDHLQYRKAGELKDWMDRCPLKKIESRLRANGIVEDNIEAIYKNIRKEVDKVYEAARKSEFPKVDELYEHVYAK